jgi:hypothetical protein
MKLFQEIKQIAEDYNGGSIEITTGLTYSQSEIIRMVEFYSNSKFLNGNKDNIGKEKPFHNIVNTMVDTAVVATDIDTKDIKVEAEREQDYDKSFLFNHEIQNWMKEANFAKTLNEMGEIRARYGGVLVKKCMDEGEMTIDVVEWKNVVTDPVDITNGIIIEKHYMTPSELRKKSGVWENIDEAIKLWNKKGYTRSDTRMEIWEVHGEFAEECLAEDPETYDDSEDYSRQVHYFAVNGNKSVHLYWELEKENPYKFLTWKKVSGRGLGRGVVEEGEEAQVWTNDAVWKKHSAMELSGKVLLKTNSKKVGNNVMTDLDNGSIITLDDGKDINVLNLLNGAMPQFSETMQQWFQQYERSTSSYGAVRGETPPSGQPYRLQALIANTGGSHFDYRREEWGIFLTELFYDWVFPYIQKKLNKKHILASDFSPEELARLDEAYAKYNASEIATEAILSGKLISQEDYLALQQQFKDFIGKGGRRRFLDIPDGYYKDMKARLTINITGEQKDKSAVLESLSNILQTMIPLVQQGIAQPQDIQLIMNKIMELSGSGVSPLSLTKSNQQAQQGVMQPQEQQIPEVQPTA